MAGPQVWFAVIFKLLSLSKFIGSDFGQAISLFYEMIKFCLNDDDNLFIHMYLRLKSQTIIYRINSTEILMPLLGVHIPSASIFLCADFILSSIINISFFYTQCSGSSIFISYCGDAHLFYLHHCRHSHKTVKWLHSFFPHPFSRLRSLCGNVSSHNKVFDGG